MIQRVFTLSVLLVLLSSQLFAHQYDNTLLDIQAKLFPKIAMLEKNIKAKNSHVLSLVIVAQDMDLHSAQKLKSRILNNYPNKILNKKIIVEIKNAKDAKDKNTDAMIVLYHPQEILESLSLWANQNKVLTFAYDPSDLEYGLLVSIYLGKSTKPYLNKQVLQDYSFVFDSYLLQVSKFKE